MSQVIRRDTYLCRETYSGHLDTFNQAVYETIDR